MPEEPISRITPAESEVSRTRSVRPEEAAKYAIQQEALEQEFMQWTELAAFNPLAMARRFESLETRVRRRGKEEETDRTKEEKKVQEVKEVEEVSEQFEQRNPELHARNLLLLRSRLNAQDDHETILKKVLEAYADYSLADEALDFLVRTAESKLVRGVEQAKETLNTLYGREIKAGRNIATAAREFSAQGLGSPTALRDMYRDITGNPRDPATLFEQLTSNFNFAKMKTVIDFLLHSLGADLKAKGPSISRAELHRLLTDARTLQAILGIYRFFGTRMNLIAGAFQKQGLTLSSRTNFEILAKLFMKYLQERYPSSEKVLQMAALLGISDEEAAQIIVFTQMRDAVRQVAPKLYKSPQHKQDVLMSFIEALEELEEEDEEEEEKKKKDE